MNFGHKIVQLQLRVRPTVLNNPRHPKHETIPASVFMPGKDGNPAAAGTEALQSLIRLLHRTRLQCVAHVLAARYRGSLSILRWCRRSHVEWWRGAVQFVQGFKV